MVAAKTYKLRGQAWVVFADVASASSAMRTMQGFPFYDKPMKLAYAKTKSDATAKVDGTFDPAARDPSVRQKRKAESQREEKASQAARAEEEEANGGPAQTIRTDPTAPPNEILFVQGLPGACGQGIGARVCWNRNRAYGATPPSLPVRTFLTRRAATPPKSPRRR